MLGDVEVGVLAALDAAFFASSDVVGSVVTAKLKRDMEGKRGRYWLLDERQSGEVICLFCK